MLLGVDVGGTFTDAVVFDGRALHTAKAPTTPEDQSRGVLAAVEAALAAGAYGARMTGGGFGGCVLALIDADRADETTAAVRRAYAEHEFTAPTAWSAVPGPGAARLS